MSTLPKSKATRKAIPLATGVLDYFPLALSAVAHCSKVGNDQHNPGETLHWAREKSTDQSDTILRHMVERGTFDDDGVRHSAKVAWRALAQLQEEIEKDGGMIWGEAAADPFVDDAPLAALEAELAVTDDGDVSVDCADCGRPVVAGGISELSDAFEDHYANDH